MIAETDIVALIEERDAKEQERSDLESCGVRIDSTQIRAIDARLRELNDRIVAYGKTISAMPEIGPANEAADGVDSGRREESR